jgi:hypothetical protein
MYVYRLSFRIQIQIQEHSSLFQSSAPTCIHRAKGRSGNALHFNSERWPAFVFFLSICSKLLDTEGLPPRT